MIRGLAFFLGIFALSGAGKLPDKFKTGGLSNTSVRISTPDHLKPYSAANSGAALTPLEGVATNSLLTYTIGSRMNGDSLVATVSNFDSYSNTRDMTFSIEYPTYGPGKIITYVEVSVLQSSSWGQVYVTQGGVGSRYIDLFLEANDTLFVQYVVKIYGL